jgi:hypothetical protein
MLNTFKNLQRKADKYGEIHFISFFSSVLSRLAYFDDNNFLKKYNAIMGPIIQPKILKGINNVNSNNLPSLLDDQSIFGLNKKKDDIFSNHEYQYKGKNFIDFISLNMPQNINIINNEVGGKITVPLPGEETKSSDVKYISIGWSNYGEIYVVADKRMPNTILLIFRGTYSAKTAALYSKPTSIAPITVCKDSSGNPEKFLYGIFKPSTEMIHTIIESMRYLAIDFLQASKPNSVKIFTTGHSLGGAMCSNFAYLWMGIKKTSPYNGSPYNVLADNIVCVSLGAPRCMSSNVAKKFCNFVSQKRILYLRITTRGDPVPGLPPKTGFQHPCSEDSKMRMEVSEDCNATLTVRPKPNINYNADLDCQNYKTRAYLPNPLSHTIYLDILYLSAVDIPKFFKGIGVAQEVSRGPGNSTICRLIMGSTDNYKAVFFDVNSSREKPTNIDAIEEKELEKTDPSALSQLQGNESTSSGGGLFPANKSAPILKIGGEVAEDRRMTKDAFNSLIQEMSILEGNLCPLKGKISNPFTNSIMPDLSCPGLKLGGKRTRKHIRTKRRDTRKHIRPKRRNNRKR